MTESRKFTLAVAMNPLDQIVELAATAEECGFASVALPDSLFYSETVSADYPYTPDGSRMWDAATPWGDPLIISAASVRRHRRSGSTRRCSSWARGIPSCSPGSCSP